MATDLSTAFTKGSSHDPFLHSLEALLHTYDETLMYACREYVRKHELYHKHFNRKLANEMIRNRAHFGIGWKNWLLLMYENPFSTRMSIAYFTLQMLVAGTSIMALLFQSTPAYNQNVFPSFNQVWFDIEVPTGALFAADIALRFCLLPNTPNEFSSGLGRRNFFTSLQVWADIASVFPTLLLFLEGTVPYVSHFSFLKVLRVLRFMRGLRALHSVDVLIYTLERSLEPLVAPFMLLTAIILVFASFIYYLERGTYDPDLGVSMTQRCDCLMSSQYMLNYGNAPPNYAQSLMALNNSLLNATLEAATCPPIASKFLSIPHSMWFMIVTLSTVGYGDIVPLCWGGRSVAAIAMLFSGVLIAMPIAIVGTFYTSVAIADSKRKQRDPSTAFGRDKLLKNHNTGKGIGNVAELRLSEPLDATDEVQPLSRQSRRRRSNALRGRAVDPKSEESNSVDENDTTEGVLSTQRSDGERVLLTMAEAFPNASIDLLNPMPEVLYIVNRKITALFTNHIQQLHSVEGIAAFKKGCSSVRTMITLQRASAPAKTMCPQTIELVRPAHFVVGTAFGLRRFIGETTLPSAAAPIAGKAVNFRGPVTFICIDEESRSDANGLPSVLCAGTLCLQKHSLTLRSVFPALCKVNGKVLTGEGKRIMLGDDVGFVCSRRRVRNTSHRNRGSSGSSGTASRKARRSPPLSDAEPGANVAREIIDRAVLKSVRRMEQCECMTYRMGRVDAGTAFGKSRVDRSAFLRVIPPSDGSGQITVSSVGGSDAPPHTGLRFSAYAK
jgi:hypothetical protein